MALDETQLSFDICFPSGLTISSKLSGWEIQLQEFQRLGEMSVFSLYHQDFSDRLCLTIGGAWPLFSNLSWKVCAMEFLGNRNSRPSDCKFIIRDELESIRCQSFWFWTSTRQLEFCGSDIVPWSKEDVTLCRY